MTNQRWYQPPFGLFLTAAVYYVDFQNIRAAVSFYTLYFTWTTVSVMSYEPGISNKSCISVKSTQNFKFMALKKVPSRVKFLLFCRIPADTVTSNRYKQFLILQFPKCQIKRMSVQFKPIRIQFIKFIHTEPIQGKVALKLLSDPIPVLSCTRRLWREKTPF